MKKPLILIAGAVLAIAACAPLQNGANSASTVADQGVLRGTQALILAHDAYDAAEALVAPMVRARVFTKAQVDAIEAINNKAEAIFNDASTVHSDAEKAQQIMDLVTQLQAFAPAKK